MRIRKWIVLALVCSTGAVFAQDAEDWGSPAAPAENWGAPADAAAPAAEAWGDVAAPAAWGEGADPSAAQGSTGRGNIINVPFDVPTISEAMTHARSGDTVRVAPGVYRERVTMAPGVALISTELFGARISGRGRGTVVTMARNGSIDGFEITNGTIGIFSSDIGNEIRRNRIVKNGMTGMVVVRQLPLIEDNIIAFNRASGIQGWDVRSTVYTVNHNTIAFNGNHGIAIGGASEFIIENNTIAFNERFGLKVRREVENVQVSNNNFWRNLFQPGNQHPPNNFVFDPAFLGARTELNFRPDPGICCVEKTDAGENLGARLDY